MQGAPPLASPGAEPGRHLHDQRFLFVYGGQCRQPRRGGPGGDGTIRRKRRRRLRWSSPPGQGEQVPPGACLSCRLPTLTLVCFFAPIPQPPSPPGKGEPKVISCKGLRPLHPRAGWGRGTGFACGKPVLSALNRAIAHTGATGIRVEKSPLPRKGACVAGAVSAVDGLMPGCRGR